MRRRCNTATRITLVLIAVLLTASQAAAVPVCTIDVQGANDEPGQKDLTLFCSDTSAGTFDLLTEWNWDSTDFGNLGGNTGDGCTLYDTSDADGNANLAVCVTVDGNPAVGVGFRLFNCNNTRADRCAGAVQLAGPFVTTCSAAGSTDDPFPAGENSPNDTKAECQIKFSDFSVASATLLNACSYPSNEPNSDPSDCVAFVECTADAQCSDGDACTSDTCVDNVCVFDDISAQCDDDNVCNGAETCEPATGCVDGTPLTCDDGAFCNGMETCDPSAGCQAGTPVSCGDGVDCTVDSCDETNDTCVNSPNDSLCNDGLFCNGDETCDSANDCQAGTAPSCGDGVDCTVDSCDETNDTCVNSPNDSLCNDGLFCNGDETCDSVNDCKAGTAPSCGDGVDCTVDSCDETNDTCANSPNDSLCNDGLFCNGDETCDAVNDCQPGTAPDCTDSVNCTVDSCDEVNDTCANAPDHSFCDNGVFCDGDEICDPQADCLAGDAPTCDGDDCNDGFCNTESDMCDKTPTNEGGSCGDDTDNACTNPDTCEAGTCLPNNEPCAAVTDSALCLFDVSTKGVCVDFAGLPTGEACDVVSDTNCNVGTCVDESQFRLLFTPDASQLPANKLNASNPGQFYYNLVAEDENCDPGVTQETFTITVPYPFVTQGARPLHVYDGADVGNAVGDDCFVPPDQALIADNVQLTLQDWKEGGANNPRLTCSGTTFGAECSFEITATYPDSCQLYINLHLDYGLKGKDVDANPMDTKPDRYLRDGPASPWGSYDAVSNVNASFGIADCSDYTFSHAGDGVGGAFFDTVQNLNDLPKVPPGVFGLVSDGGGTGQAGLTVRLLLNGVEVATGVTNDDGFYFIAYKHKGKQAAYNTQVVGFAPQGTIELKGGSATVEANFNVTTGVWTY